MAATQSKIRLGGSTEPATSFRDQILMALATVEGNSLPNRLPLHTIMYVVSRDSGQKATFRALPHGLFSPSLKAAVDDLIDDGFVSVSDMAVVKLDPHVGHVRVQTEMIVLTDDGKTIAPTAAKMAATVKKVVGMLARETEWRNSDMAVIGQLIYLKSLAAREEDVSVQARRLGWDLDSESAARFERVVEKLTTLSNA